MTIHGPVDESILMMTCSLSASLSVDESRPRLINRSSLGSIHQQVHECTWTNRCNTIIIMLISDSSTGPHMYMDESMDGPPCHALTFSCQRCSTLPLTTRHLHADSLALPLPLLPSHTKSLTHSYARSTNTHPTASSKRSNSLPPSLFLSPDCFAMMMVSTRSTVIAASDAARIASRCRHGPLSLSFSLSFSFSLSLRLSLFLAGSLSLSLALSLSFSSLCLAPPPPHASLSPTLWMGMRGGAGASPPAADGDRNAELSNANNLSQIVVLPAIHHAQVQKEEPLQLKYSRPPQPPRTTLTPPSRVRVRFRRAPHLGHQVVEHLGLQHVQRPCAGTVNDI
jgi:hypothetical protein